MKSLSIKTDYQIKRDCDGVDWRSVKKLYRASKFDNGREPRDLRQAFENSFSVCFALLDEKVVGTARAISDGVGCAALFDVCVHPECRRRGIGAAMVQAVVADLGSQSILLTTTEPEFYRHLGFKSEPGAMVRS